MAHPCGEDGEGYDCQESLLLVIERVGRGREGLVNTVKECLKKRGSDVRQASRMVQDRSEWQGFVRGNA